MNYKVNNKIVLNKTNKIFIIIIIFFISFATSCVKKGGIKEGELIYKITYIYSEDDYNTNIAFYPKELSMKFKDDNTVVSVSGMFGSFLLKFITNRDTKKSYSVLRILDQKYLSTVGINELLAGYEDYPDFEIIKREDDTLTIHSLLCYRADVKCKGLSDSLFSIYYTYDIDIKDPNSNTIFSDIDGVLVSFQSNLIGVNMKFDLEEFNHIKINKKEFLPPKNYEKVPRQKISEILNNFKQ